jgi:hypothetical protein
MTTSDRNRADEKPRIEIYTPPREAPDEATRHTIASADGMYAVALTHAEADSIIAALLPHAIGAESPWQTVERLGGLRRACAALRGLLATQAQCDVCPRPATRCADVVRRMGLACDVHQPDASADFSDATEIRAALAALGEQNL